jgi:Na+-translocating ferredoxin:NAD+ oxidoreductase RnfE subunit
MVLAPGAFFTLALMITLYNLVRARAKPQKGGAKP